MRIRLYKVDAFASGVFEGNPAAVCPLDRWLDDGPLRALAEENHLSETAFFIPGSSGFDLRGFTPLTEVDLCEHATLAAAHLIFERLGRGRPSVTFGTRSGHLIVKKLGTLLQMDFAACPPRSCEMSEELVQSIGPQATT